MGTAQSVDFCIVSADLFPLVLVVLVCAELSTDHDLVGKRPLSLFDGRRNDESDPSSYLWRRDFSWLYSPMRAKDVRPQVGHR